MIPISVQEKIDSILPGADYPATVMKPLLQAIADAAFGTVPTEPVPYTLESGQLFCEVLSVSNEIEIEFNSGDYFIHNDFLVLALTCDVNFTELISETDFTLSIKKLIDESGVIIREGYVFSRNIYFQLIGATSDYIIGTVRGTPNTNTLTFTLSSTVNAPFRLHSHVFIRIQPEEIEE
jgi:hypothetical protein